MSISGQTAPSGSLQQGKFFAIKGIISSNLNITKVWGVYGKIEMQKKGSKSA